MKTTWSAMSPALASATTAGSTQLQRDSRAAAEAFEPDG
jgi:hypothetical protein